MFIIVPISGTSDAAAWSLVTLLLIRFRPWVEESPVLPVSVCVSCVL